LDDGFVRAGGRGALYGQHSAGAAMGVVGIGAGLAALAVLWFVGFIVRDTVCRLCERTACRLRGMAGCIWRCDAGLRWDRWGYAFYSLGSVEARRYFGRVVRRRRWRGGWRMTGKRPQDGIQ
jgi:hypothetical protein